MFKRIGAFVMAMLMTVPLFGCSRANEEVKIGVSLGVGAAVRWEKEKVYMEEKAAELGVEIEVRLNKTDTPKTQQQDCFEMIDAGIDTLILTPRDAGNVKEILDYARSKKVPVINYARVVLGEKVDLIVGYDSNRMGQKMGQYLSEMVTEGDYIILSGPPEDNNAKLLYDGAMRYIKPIKPNINIILDTTVPDWSSDEAKAIVLEAIKANGNKIDAILAPNDKIAGACAEVIEELGITEPVAITGMDAELEAAKRIVAGTQSSTIYMELKELAGTAVTEAVNLGKGEKVNVNAEYDNQSGGTIPANLITGQLVVAQNLDKVLIESGYLTHAEVYNP